MKTLKNLWIALCTVVAATTLTSCDVDLPRAINLSGEWQGDFGMYYDYVYYGRTCRFESYDTRLAFYPAYDYATYGYGKQVDYYDYGPYTYQYYYFNWYIDRGDLILEYPYDPALNTVIHDYHMYSTSFYGYFGTSNTKFYLRKLVDYYDWGYYNGNYLYGQRDNWYNYYPRYAKSGAAPADTLSPVTTLPSDSTSTGEAGIIRRGNRMNEAH